VFLGGYVEKTPATAIIPSNSPFTISPISGRSMVGSFWPLFFRTGGTWTGVGDNTPEAH